MSVAPTVMNVSSLSPITNHSYQPPDGKIVLSSYWGHKKVETTIKYLGENNERLVEATDQYYSNNENLYQIADFL